MKWYFVGIIMLLALLLTGWYFIDNSQQHIASALVVLNADIDLGNQPTRLLEVRLAVTNRSHLPCMIISVAPY